MKGPLILIVEGSATTRDTMRTTLQAQGYAVCEARDGESALRVVAEQAPMLVLLDMNLPDMDGLDVQRRLRALAPGLPVVAVPGWARADDARLLTAGFLDVQVKPLEAGRLVEIVRHHVGRASNTRRNPPTPAERCCWQMMIRRSGSSRS